MQRFLRAFGVILMLGGTAHCFGVTRLYLTHGVPDANRVLLDIWIGEAQLIGGALYLMASRARESARLLILFGALTIIGYAVPILPVLFQRAPIIFRVMPIVYALGSVVALTGSRRQA